MYSKNVELLCCTLKLIQVINQLYFNKNLCPKKYFCKKRKKGREKINFNYNTYKCIYLLHVCRKSVKGFMPLDEGTMIFGFYMHLFKLVLLLFFKI